MGRVRVLSNSHPQPDAPGSAPPFGDGVVTRRFRDQREKPAPGDCDIVLLQSAYRTVVEHLRADTSREHGGLLLGLEVPAPGGGRTVFVLHALPGAGTTGGPVSLTFTPETWAEFDRLTEAYDKTGFRLRRVGWYHSHPRIAIFLSQWDLDVCQDFDRPTDVALVVDPVGDKGAFFVRGAAGYRPGSPQGFVEFCDLQPETVVTWGNVSATTVPAPEPTPLPKPVAAVIPPPLPVPVPQPAPQPVTVPVQVPVTRWRPTIAAGIVAAVALIGWGATWGELQSANGQVAAGAEQGRALRGAADRAEAARAAAEQQAQVAAERQRQAEAAARRAEAARDLLTRDHADAQAKAKELERSRAEDVREMEAMLAKLKRRLGLPDKP